MAADKAEVAEPMAAEAAAELSSLLSLLLDSVSVAEEAFADFVASNFPKMAVYCCKAIEAVLLPN